MTLKKYDIGWIPKNALLALLALSGCHRSSEVTPQQQMNSPVSPTVQARDPKVAQSEKVAFKFKDVTTQAGITFQHNNGAFGASLLPETMGSGALWFDYDSDGDPDIFFVNGRDWTKQEVEAYRKSPVKADEAQFLAGKPAKPLPRLAKPGPYRRTTGALYRNDGNGTFSDATKESGLDVETMGMGCASADYDGDSKPDLCLTSYGRLLLFRNLGNGRFKDVSDEAGIHDSQWSTSAAWLDYNRDGRLDLFVCRYVQWSPAIENFNSLDKLYKSYGWPKDFKSQTCRLFRNVDGKHFRDVSVEAGIAKNLQTRAPLLGAALGVAVCDLNHDSWPDMVVSNDQRPNFFFLNNGEGKFIEYGGRSGLAMGNLGRPRGGMGIDVADVDHSGLGSVAIGHFNAEGMGFWQVDGHESYRDIAQQTEIGSVTSTLLTFGLLFVDVNNDSWFDLLAVNGHVDPTVHNFLMLVTYEQPPVLFLNQTASKGGQGKPQFHDVAAQVGLENSIVGRGLCAADYDLDGDLDMLITTVAGRPYLMRNDGGNANNSVRLILRAKAPNGDGLGARIKAVIGKDTVRHYVHTGSSYLSQNEIPLTIGMGGAAKIDQLTIRWPDKTKTQLKDVGANQIVTVAYDGKITARRAFPGAKRP